MANQTDISVGWKKESTYGTPVTVDRWSEVVDAPWDYDPAIVQGEGLRVGSGGVAPSNRRVLTTQQGKGEFTVELFTRGLGTLLELATGVGASTDVDAGGTYQQNFTLGTGLMPSGTFQVGLPDATGTVRAHTYAGVTCEGFELSVPNANIATLKTMWHARALSTATALTTVDYSSGDGGSLYHWGLAAITYGGTVTNPADDALASGGTALTGVRDFTLSVAHNLAGDRFNMGGSGLPAQPIPGKRTITGSFTAEFDAVTLRDAYLNQTANPLTVTLTSAEALNTGYATLQVCIPEIYLDGTMPKANKGELITTQVTFSGTDDGTSDEPLWVCLRTADTAL